MRAAFVVETRNGAIDRCHALEGDAPEAPADPAAIVAAVAATKKVLVFAHGGVVDRDAGMGIARRLSMGGESGFPDSDVVQLYVVWNSGLLDALGNSLRNSVLGKITEAVATFFETEVRAAPDSARRLKRPMSDADLDLYYRPRLSQVNREAPDTQEFMAPQGNAQTAVRGAKSVTATTTGLVQVAIRATRAILARAKTNPPDYAFEAMAIEEVLNASPLGGVGKAIWAQMKRDATAHADSDFQTLFRAVCEHSDQTVVVAHSAGAILVTALLGGLHDKGEALAQRFTLVLLAPAITIDAYSSTFPKISHLLKDKAIIYNLTTELEGQDSLRWGEVRFYPGSILNLVNFAFEDQNPGRLLGLNFYAEQMASKEQVVVMTDHSCTSHSGFDDNPAILERISGLTR